MATDAQINRRMFGPNIIQLPPCVRTATAIETPKSASSASASKKTSPVTSVKIIKTPKPDQPATEEPTVANSEIEMWSSDKHKKGPDCEPPLAILSSPVAGCDAVDDMIDSPFKPEAATTEAATELTNGTRPLGVQLSHQSPNDGAETGVSVEQTTQTSAMVADESMSTAMAMDIPQLPMPINQVPQPFHQPVPAVQPPQPFHQPVPAVPPPQPFFPPQQGGPQAPPQGRIIRKAKASKRRPDETAQDNMMQSMTEPAPRLSASSFASGPTSSNTSLGSNLFGGGEFVNPQENAFQASPLTTGSGFFPSASQSSFGTPQSFNSFAISSNGFSPRLSGTPSQQQSFGNQFPSTPRSSFGSTVAQSPSSLFGAPPSQQASPSAGVPGAVSSPLSVFGSQTHSPAPFQMQATPNPQPPPFGGQSFPSPHQPSAFRHPSSLSPRQPPPFFGQQQGQESQGFGRQSMPSEQPFMPNVTPTFNFGRQSTPAKRTSKYGRRKGRN